MPRKIVSDTYFGGEKLAHGTRRPAKPQFTGTGRGRTIPIPVKRALINADDADYIHKFITMKEASDAVDGLSKSAAA